MTEAEVVQLMESSKTIPEWNANCKAVQVACGGEYPDFWHSAIVKSGLADRVIAAAGGPK